MVRASRFGGAALIAGVLCLATCTTRVGGDYVQPVANPGDEPGQVLPVDLDTGMPVVPPAFPPSFVARVAWRVTRAEGETDAVVHGDDGGSGSGLIARSRRCTTSGRCRRSASTSTRGKGR
jgi:hypothetical protein